MIQLLLIFFLLGQVLFLFFAISEFTQSLGQFLGLIGDLVNLYGPINCIAEGQHPIELVPNTIYFYGGSSLVCSSILVNLKFTGYSNNLKSICSQLFHTNPSFNAPIYLYNRDKSVLYFTSSKHDYVEKLGIHNSTLEDKINKGLLYLGKYSITMTPPTLDAKLHTLTLEEIKAMLDQDRSKIQAKFKTSGMPLLHPYFVTGFTDGDGCFMVPIVRSKSKLGWSVSVRFSFCLHEKDRPLLEAIQSYFKGAGNIYEGNNNLILYTVSSLDDIINIIIPHFDKYPLLTQKGLDFANFKSIAELIQKKDHLSDEGFKKILSLKASLNKGLPLSLKEAFPLTTPANTPLVPVIEIQIPDPHWVVGFCEAEGCFYIKIWNSSTTKTGQQVSFQFQLTQHSRDILLMNKLVTYLGCGKVGAVRKDLCCNFVTTNFSEITEKIIPFFLKYELKGAKALNFALFKEGATLVKNKEHLTTIGLNSLKEIKDKMNK